jgi:hypothetical protein
VRSNAYVLWDLLKTTVGNPEAIRPTLLVYTKWSVDPREGKRARQVGVGFWQRSLVRGVPDQWIDFIIFFKEEYNVERQVWIQTVPPTLRRTRFPWSPL